MRAQTCFIVSLVVLGTSCGLSACSADEARPGAAASAVSAPGTTVPADTTPPPTEQPTATTVPPAPAGGSPPQGSEPATVASVTDGDTIRVSNARLDAERLRLIGINTPESGECFYDEATDGLEELLVGRDVYLVTDVSDRDQFDRLLRYVFLPDGTFVNEEMVRSGLAIARDYPPDSSRADVLAAAQREAERAGAGLWAEAACGEAASGSIAVAHIEYDAPGNDNFALDGEWVDLENRAVGATDLTGWVLKDESATHRYDFPSGFVLGGGAGVRIHTGCGEDTTVALYWCSSGAVWNNDGDTAFLLDPNGNIHAQSGY